jgi:hypothetical protein
VVVGRSFSKNTNKFVPVGVRSTILVSLPHTTSSPQLVMDVPLVVFVNTKSGGQQGIKIIDKFKKCVPPENVFDLSRDGPMPG